ncbi:unnamed protein product [Lactuca saligna]|uniref:Uncharacterized protein n=1 Tax=Lactuca saligna TaxID=75948 RepID=A0AA35YWC3_LACSI|nr:unnamed protein product [Lactuca saligna]
MPTCHAFSETPYAADQSASSWLLGINANHNLILDLDPPKYDAFLQTLIECLRYSPLATTLSKTENVHLALLSKAYSTTRYEESGVVINFEHGGELRKTYCGGKATDGGDDHEQNPKSNDLKDNVASTSRVKEKLSTECILNEGINNPSVYWRELVTSFEFENTLDSQLDFPMTSKVFLFCILDRAENALESDNNVNLLLISFYLKYMKPQYKTWSSKKITVVKVYGPIENKSFLNAHFKVTHGAVSSVFEFTLTDFPCLNPFDWISLLLLLLKDENKFEPLVAYLKRLLVSYIQEIRKMDVGIVNVLRKRPTVFPKEPLKDLNKMKLGSIRKDDWSVAFQI